MYVCVLCPDGCPLCVFVCVFSYNHKRHQIRLPNRGTASDVAGMVSATILRKTVKDNRIVTPGTRTQFGCSVAEGVARVRRMEGGEKGERKKETPGGSVFGYDYNWITHMR